jgi:hypothetical protein
MGTGNWKLERYADVTNKQTVTVVIVILRRTRIIRKVCASDASELLHATVYSSL